MDKNSSVDAVVQVTVLAVQACRGPWICIRIAEACAAMSMLLFLSHAKVGKASMCLPELQSHC